MPKSPNNHKWKWFFLASVVMLVFFVLAFGREYIGNIQVEEQIALLNQQKQKLDAEQLSTIDVMKQLSSSYYLESYGREKQGLGAPGETRVIIETPTVQVDPNSTAIEDTPSLMTNASHWFDYFFDKARFEQLSRL